MTRIFESSPALNSSPNLAAKAEKAILFAAASLPFVDFARYAPMPYFWGEWAAIVLYLAWAVVALLHRETVEDAAFPPVFWALPALAVLTFVQASLAMPIYPSEAILAGLQMVAAAACGIAAALCRERRRDLLAAWCAGIVVALLANAGAALLHRFGFEVLGLHLLTIRPTAREIGFVGQANHLGALSVLAICASRYLESERRLSTRLLFCIAGVAGILLAASGSRIGLIQLFAVAIIEFAYRRNVEHADRSSLGFVLAIVISIQCAWLIFHFTDGINLSDTVVRIESYGRPALLEDAFRLFLLHPWLGVGWNHFAASRIFELDTPLVTPHATHPHNLLAQALSEWGAIGGIIVGLACLRLLRALWGGKNSNDPNTVRLVACAVIAILLHSMVEHPLWSSYFLFGFTWLVGIAAPTRSSHGLSRPRPPLIIGSAIVAAVLLAYLADQYLHLSQLAKADFRPLPGEAETPQPTLRDLIELSATSLTPKFPEAMLVRRLPISRERADQELQIAKRVFSALPQPDTAALYAIFLTVAKGPDSGMRFIEDIDRRNAPMAKRSRAALQAAFPADPRIAALDRLLDASEPQTR